MKSKHTILLNIAHHPIEKCNVTVVEVPWRHQTLQQLKEEFTQGEVLAGLDGKQVEIDARPVHPGAEVVFIPAAAGPAIAGAAAWVWGITGWAFVTQMAIAYGLSYLGGVLFGPDIPPAPPPEREGGQSFSWAPVTTQKEGIPHPMCYGTNMHYGNVVARWTDVDESGNEVLYMILDYGRGPVQGRGSNPVYFNDQPSTNFPGVTIQERLGTLNQTCMTGFEQNKLEYRPARMKIANTVPITWTTPNNFFDDIEYSLVFPRGLYHYQDDGSRVSHSVGVRVQISVRGENDWTTLMDTSVSGDQLAPLFKAYKVSEQGFNCVHGIQYDLKFAKTTGDESSGRYGDELYLRAVREVVDVAFTRPGKALLGITALATEGLSGHIDVKWVADDKLVRVYDGAAWGLEFTRNRSFIVLDELTQPVVSGDGGANPWTIERYEGIDPTRVDLAFFYEWAVWCDQQVPSGVGEETEDRMPCDIICDWQTDVWSLCYELSQVGRMYPYWQGNVLTGWVDKATDDVIDLVTFDNTMVRSWKSGWAGFGEKAGSVEIFYKDALQGYERKSRPLSNEDAGLHTRVVALEGVGVTSYALATRVGNHTLQRNKLIKNINSVRMYKDALRYRLGKVVRLQSNVPAWGTSYRVISVPSATTVELDRVAEGEVAPESILYVRNYDEANKEVTINSYTVVDVDGKIVTVEEVWDPTPIKNNMVAIGVAGEIKLRRIVKMRCTVNNYFDVEFEDYDVTLFDSDDTDPNLDNPVYEWPAPPSKLTEPITKWEVVELINQMIPPRPDIDIPWTSNLNWTGSGGDTVSWSKRDADEPILFRFRGTSYVITPDSTTDLFIYWDPSYTDQFRHTNDAGVALAAGHWLMCTNQAGVAMPVIPIPLLHAAILQAGTITAAYGQIADAAIETAKIKDLAVQTLKIKDNAVTIPVSAFTASEITFGTSVTTVQSVTITTTGNIVRIVASVAVTPSGAGARKVGVRIYRGGVQLYNANWIQALIGFQFPVSFNIEDNPTAGTYTYYLKCYTETDLCSAYSRSLWAIEIKK